MGSATAWVVAGLLAGLAGYGWGGSPAGEDKDDWTEGRAAVNRPSVRLLAVIGVAVACLVAALATPASDAGWAVLAVGLLGLAVAWVLSDQERRIRHLERQLRERRDGT
jgi:peptidoglycan/LPS O-acetylase OafA/YrhL